MDSIVFTPQLVDFYYFLDVIDYRQNLRTLAKRVVQETERSNRIKFDIDKAVDEKKKIILQGVFPEIGDADEPIARTKEQSVELELKDDISLFALFEVLFDQGEFFNALKVFALVQKGIVNRLCDYPESSGGRHKKAGHSNDQRRMPISKQDNTAHVKCYFALLLGSNRSAVDWKKPKDAIKALQDDVWKYIETWEVKQIRSKDRLEETLGRWMKKYALIEDAYKLTDDYGKWHKGQGRVYKGGCVFPFKSEGYVV